MPTTLQILPFPPTMESCPCESVFGLQDSHIDLRTGKAGQPDLDSRSCYIDGTDCPFPRSILGEQPDALRLHRCELSSSSICAPRYDPSLGLGKSRDDPVKNIAPISGNGLLSLQARPAQPRLAAAQTGAAKKSLHMARGSAHLQWQVMRNGLSQGTGSSHVAVPT